MTASNESARTIPPQYDQSYGEQLPPQQPARSARSTGELDAATGVHPDSKRKRSRVPMSLAALVVIGVVAIVLGPSLIWAFSLTLRPSEVSSSMPEQSEAVTISVTSGMLGVLGGYAIGSSRNARSREDLGD